MSGWMPICVNVSGLFAWVWSWIKVRGGFMFMSVSPVLTLRTTCALVRTYQEVRNKGGLVRPGSEPTRRFRICPHPTGLDPEHWTNPKNFYSNVDNFFVEFFFRKKNPTHPFNILSGFFYQQKYLQDFCMLAEIPQPSWDSVFSVFHGKGGIMRSSKDETNNPNFQAAPIERLCTRALGVSFAHTIGWGGL